MVIEERSSLEVKRTSNFALLLLAVGAQAVVDGGVLAASMMASRDPAEALTRDLEAASR
jgi:hypothetical protein